MTDDQTTHDLRRTQQTVLDAVVIGGGAAGLSAGLTLARARRDVLVVDAGEPRNASAEGVHGFLTRDGVPPLELLRLGRAEVESYGGRVLTGVARAVRAVPDEGAARFVVTVASSVGEAVEVPTRRLIVATGLTDELPPIPGVAERWGRDVVHCPYCHGWEIRDRTIGVLARNAFSHHQALLFRQWSDDVTLFLHGIQLTDEQLEELAARDVSVVDARVTGLRVEDDRLTGVMTGSGRTVPVGALAISAPGKSNAEVLAGLGILPAPHPAGFGTAVPNDPLTGATDVAGVWVAGNVGDLIAQVITAAASGVRVGAAVNADLIAEETRSAVTARRASETEKPVVLSDAGRVGHEEMRR